MKKLMSFATIVACLGSLAACATTAVVAKPGEDELAKLKRQNAELKLRVAAQYPAAAPTMADLVPPPAQRRVSPPENWGWLDQRPEGCSTGVYAMEIQNDSGFYLDLLINGEHVKVRGSRGLLPGVPPGTSVWICLGHLGQQTLTGTFYACRGGPGTTKCQLQKIGYLRWTDHWNTRTTFRGHQYAQIHPSCVIEEY
ncbi:MAG: hypothetical protein WCT10_04395 [Patescibacteria group bacterium]|jgi:hypothetical protein